MTYYNEAGNALVALARRHGIDDPHAIVVVHDELDLPVGRLKLKVGGGLAGNNGLKSIKRELGGENFLRVRVGVGRPDSTDPEIVASYVLGRFQQSETEVAGLVDEAREQVERAVLSTEAS